VKWTGMREWERISRPEGRERNETREDGFDRSCPNGRHKKWKVLLYGSTSASGHEGLLLLDTFKYNIYRV
jgi:hypothetical protein